MCGIFGISLGKKSTYCRKEINLLINHLSNQAESRGKDSSGVAAVDTFSKKINIIKSGTSISSLIRSPIFKKQFASSLESYKALNPLIIFGHSRLVTNGSQVNHQNNQPVVKGNIVSIHNGIIVNDSNLWRQNDDLERKFEIDTEIFNSLVSKYLSSFNFARSVSEAAKKVEGTISTVVLSKLGNEIILYTNNSSLHYLTNFKDFLAFSSERSTLTELHENSKFLDNNYRIFTIKPGEGILHNFETFSISELSRYLKKDSSEIGHEVDFGVDIKQIDGNLKKSLLLDIEKPKTFEISKEKSILEYNEEAIDNLRRCTCCVLPETFPYIKYDLKGICNYCHGSKIKHPRQLNDLRLKIKEYINEDDKPNCIVPFSGGRDSTFALHFIKKELGLNPIAFTYDWGMVTDLARRNIARVCGKLGVENIIVAADINLKRKYIRDNVNAWLRNPSLGMVPLFMAGDKQFFYHTEELKKKTNIKLNIWGINELENTDFKIGFANVSPNFNKKDIYALSLSQKFSLLSYLIKNLITTPEYINESLFDNLKGHFSRFSHSKDHFFNFFDYYEWNENEINDLIIKEYNWETAVDTVSTWRIGDGTASFYNYIYYTVAGFSEIDTFRSNQIRRGLITRDEALKNIKEENLPRYENLKWYLDIIGVDYNNAVKTINSIPKFYSVQT